jgi:WD40 repeat protein
MVDITTLSNPFPGLRSYEYEDHALFFGRDVHIRELRQKLLGSGFLALIGSSGSGKSSLIKAGLIPSLENARDDKGAWTVVVFKPGAHPVFNLIGALHGQLRKMAVDGFSQDLPDTDWTLETAGALVLKLVSALGGNKLLLVIDQFEEVFRYDMAVGGDREVRAEASVFIEIMLMLIDPGHALAYAAITMRSDYLDHCTDFPGLTEAINLGYYLLPKMTQREVREIIVKPIETSGAEISPELVEILLLEIDNNPDSLPILQHALLRTWNKWSATQPPSAPLSVTEYEAIGTMKNSITVHAEEIYNQKLDDRRKNAAEKLFKMLILLGANDAPTLRPTPLKDIVQITGVPEYQLIDVIDAFREKGVSFLSPHQGIFLSPDTIIDLTAERILNLWTRLSRWIDEELESAKLYKQLSNTALLYNDGKAGLWVNPELQLGLKWQKDNKPTAEWARRYDPYFERAINYLEYSRKEYEFAVKSQEDKQRKALTQSRYLAIMGIGLAIVATVAVLYLTYLQAETKQALKESDIKGQVAQTERKRAEEQSKEAVVQSKIAEQQQEIAEQQRLLTDEQKQIAFQQREIAVKKEKEAVQATLLANRSESTAQIALEETRQQKKIVENEKLEVLRQKLKVDTLVLVANRQRQKADAATEKEKQLRLLAIARSMAIQSYQMPDSKDDLAALLALQAYHFNDQNTKDSPDLFNALSKLAESKTVLRRHTDIVRSISINADHTRLASASEDGSVKIWSLADLSGRPESFLLPKGVSKDLRSVLFSEDGKTVFAGTSDGRLLGWNGALPTAPAKVIRAQNAPVNTLLYANAKLISVSSEGSLRSWKVRGNALDSIQHVRTRYPLLCAALSPDKEVLMCGSTGGKILAFDLSDLAKAPVVYSGLEFGNQVSSLAFSPDGKKLISSNNYGSLYAWNLKDNLISGRPVAITGRHTSAVNSIIFSPNGKKMASCSFDGTIHIWNYKDLLLQQQPVVIRDNDNWVMDLCFTADSNRLISCGADKTVRVWDINTDQLYAKVLAMVKRNFTPDEWNTYIGKDIEYQKTIRE